MPCSCALRLHSIGHRARLTHCATLAFPSIPPGFATFEDARQWVAAFVAWYNEEHRHSGIRFVTPLERHLGKDAATMANRRQVYEAARARKPERWSGKTRNWAVIKEVWLNPEKKAATFQIGVTGNPRENSIFYHGSWPVTSKCCCDGYRGLSVGRKRQHVFLRKTPIFPKK